MNDTMKNQGVYTLNIGLGDLVPQEPLARAEWLEKHGSRTGRADVRVVANYRDWVHIAACLDADGSLAPVPQAHTILEEAVVKLGRESGQLPEILPEAVRIQVFQEIHARLREIALKGSALGLGESRNALEMTYPDFRLTPFLRALLTPDEYAERVRVLQEERSQRQAEADAREAERVAQHEEAQRHREAERLKDEARVKERRAQVLALLRTHGQGTEAERFEAGVLPDRELRLRLLELSAGPALHDSLVRKGKWGACHPDEVEISDLAWTQYGDVKNQLASCAKMLAQFGIEATHRLTEVRQTRAVDDDENDPDDYPSRPMPWIPAIHFVFDVYGWSYEGFALLGKAVKVVPV